MTFLHTFVGFQSCGCVVIVCSRWYPLISTSIICDTMLLNALSGPSQLLHVSLATSEHAVELPWLATRVGYQPLLLLPHEVRNRVSISWSWSLTISNVLDLLTRCLILSSSFLLHFPRLSAPTFDCFALSSAVVVLVVV